MPATLTIALTSTEPLFFDQAWPLEKMLLDSMELDPDAGSQPVNGQFKPYTLSPLWRQQLRGVATALASPLDYHWRVTVLDDTLTPTLVRGIEGQQAFSLDHHQLTLGSVRVETQTYEQLAQAGERQVRANSYRYLNLEFLTPVVLYRTGMSYPLPDPILIFHHYLELWDSFAPRQLWVNVNVLDGIAAHLALIEHRLETRPVRLGSGSPKTGFLGQVTYKMLGWEKLGLEFLASLHTLAHFSEWCGTGKFTDRGLGQTRLGRRRR